MTQRHIDDNPYIAITQPRKMAAIPDKRRCLPPGAVGGSVGYAVWLDRCVDLRLCHIVYMTIGILLRIMVNGKGRAAGEKLREETADADGVVLPLSMKMTSHLIIDKTHERDVT